VLVEVFEAIAQPKRREILRLLADGEMSAGDVASRFEVTQPAISQHLKVLKETGLVSERREGTRRLYSVRPEGMGDLQDFLAQVVPAGLQRLKQAAEAEERSRGRSPERN
jgi:DNA-binding transcriptional ArsR family regulator